MWKPLFWFSLFILFYSYLGYGILIYLLIRLKVFLSKKNRPDPVPGFEPEVSLIISAYNEEDFIEKKILNSLDLDYPAEKLRLIIITDGSDDKTAAIIRNYPQIQLLHEAERRGKVAAMNRAMQYVRTPFVIFSDANTLLNRACVKEMVKHYADPKTGGVAGEKKVLSGRQGKAAGAGEGLYWKYESLLKKLDSGFNTVVGAAGELFSVRTTLFHETPEDTIIEDLVQSLQVCRQGYIIRYEPMAYATETASVSMREEQKRKIRISAGAFQAMLILKDIFNPFKYPLLAFQFISHRVLRWTLSPVCLIILFISNLGIVYQGGDRLYLITLLLQTVFYAMASMGWLFANHNLRIKGLYVPYYFMFMNLSVFIGFYRFIRKRQTSIWEKALRHTGPTGDAGG
jgi:cellulose synthase/poly-beta-1,6-N-acetylglucosamine synthase-like glycosyltransferase